MACRISDVVFSEVIAPAQKCAAPSQLKIPLSAVVAAVAETPYLFHPKGSLEHFNYITAGGRVKRLQGFVPLASCLAEGTSRRYSVRGKSHSSRDGHGNEVFICSSGTPMIDSIVLQSFWMRRQAQVERVSMWMQEVASSRSFRLGLKGCSSKEGYWCSNVSPFMCVA